MDSKQRHKLEQNELAKWIVTQYEDWMRPNSSWLGYAVLITLVIIVAVMVIARVNTWNQKAAWKQYYTALHSPQAAMELELVANSTSGIVGIYARLAFAQQQLSEGCSQVFVDKKEAIVLLEKAIASFQQVQKATKDPHILQQAAFGLGKGWEALAAARVGDDLAKAHEEYSKIASQWENTFEGRQAKMQLVSLRQPSTRLFLEQMATKVAEDPAMENFKESLGFTNPFDFSNIEVTPATEEQATETNDEE